MSTKGQCLCGAVKVTISTTNLAIAYPTLCCHCTSCKRRSGGLASYAFCVPASDVTITGSAHKTMEDRDTASGHPMVRTMCGDCGSPVAIIEHSQPNTRCMQYGLFAGEVELPKPKLEMFTSRMCTWETTVGEDVRQKD